MKTHNLTRKNTVRLMELMDEGAIDIKTLAEACLHYMSEDEVSDMARINDLGELLGDEDEEEEE